MRKFFLVALLAATLAVVVAVVAFTQLGGTTTEQEFDALGELDAPDAGQRAAEAAPKMVAPALPDPRLAREKLWEEKREGPPPEGFGSHFVQHEKVLHGVFRRGLGDTIELCLDEMRRRGQSYRGNLTFHVTAIPAAGLKMRFRLNGIQSGPTPAGGTHGAEPSDGELPPDVYQCIWDTVEALEFNLPPLALGIFPLPGHPEIFVPYEVREQSPAGPIQADEMTLDAGIAAAPREPEEPAQSWEGGDAGVAWPDAGSSGQH